MPYVFSSARAYSGVNISIRRVPRVKKNEQIIDGDNAESDMYLDGIHGCLVAHLNRGSFAFFFLSGQDRRPREGRHRRAYLRSPLEEPGQTARLRGRF